jgi:outer membrane murein-binding lipoprotein Lpp
MDVVGSVVVAVLVLAVGFVLARITGARSDELNERVGRLEERLDERIEGLEARLDGLRGDLTAVALAVGASRRGGQAGSRH